MTMGRDRHSAPSLDFPIGSGTKAPTVLAWPKRIALNPYFETVSEGLARRGWRVRDFSYLRAFAGSFDILHMHNPSFPFDNRRLWITAARLMILAAILIYLRAR